MKHFLSSRHLLPLVAGVSRCCTSLCVALWIASAAQSQAGDEPAPSVSLHDTVTREIVKEPEYDSAPKYALLVLDAEGKCKVWMVEDGERLYVDRNGNADLTDDGPPLEPMERRNFSPGHWDFDYLLDEFTPPGPRVTKFRLAKWEHPDSLENHGLSLTLNGIRPMYAGWFGLWSKSAETAPVIHFGGKLMPRKLRGQEFVLDGMEQRLSIGFVNHGRSIAEHARLSYEALPESVIPVVDIKWPVNPGETPLQTSHHLRDRCCYWEFYDEHFQIPKGVVPGMATLTVSIPSAVLTFELSHETISVPVRVADQTSLEK